MRKIGRNLSRNGCFSCRFGNCHDGLAGVGAAGQDLATVARLHTWCARMVARWLPALARMAAIHTWCAGSAHAGKDGGSPCTRCAGLLVPLLSLTWCGGMVARDLARRWPGWPRPLASASPHAPRARQVLAW